MLFFGFERPKVKYKYLIFGILYIKNVDYVHSNKYSIAYLLLCTLIDDFFVLISCEWCGNRKRYRAVCSLGSTPYFLRRTKKFYGGNL